MLNFIVSFRIADKNKEQLCWCEFLNQWCSVHNNKEIYGFEKVKQF